MADQHKLIRNIRAHQNIQNDTNSLDSLTNWEIVVAPTCYGIWECLEDFTNVGVPRESIENAKFLAQSKERFLNAVEHNGDN